MQDPIAKARYLYGLPEITAAQALDYPSNRATPPTDMPTHFVDEDTLLWAVHYFDDGAVFKRLMITPHVPRFRD